MTPPPATGSSLARPTLEQVTDAIAARAAEHDRDATFPHEAFDELWSAGLLNLTVPAAVGGGGGGLATACSVTEDVGRADPSVALVLSQHLLYHFVLAAGAEPWPAPVREELQRSSLEGVALINALRVEPELGTPARGGVPATVATEGADGSWSLRGHKIYATGIPRLRWLAVLARTDEDEPRVGTFVVDACSPGYRVEQTWDHLGMRATRSDDVVFDGTPVAATHAVGLQPASGPPVGVDPLLMAWNNLLIAAVYHGVARAARDWLTGYLHERVPSGLGRPLATLPRFQEAVGRIEARLHTSGRLLSGAARDVDDGGDRGAAAAVESALVKHTVTTNAIEATSEAIGLIGNPGLSRRNPLERHLRNVLCSRIHTPQDDTILLGAGRQALDRAADGGGG